jgi:hypothetical protein
VTEKADAYLMALGTLFLERNLLVNFDHTAYGQQMQERLDKAWQSLTLQEQDYVKLVLEEKKEIPHRPDDSITLSDLILEDK